MTLKIQNSKIPQKDLEGRRISQAQEVDNSVTPNLEEGPVDSISNTFTGMLTQGF